MNILMNRHDSRTEKLMKEAGHEVCILSAAYPTPADSDIVLLLDRGIVANAFSALDEIRKESTAPVIMLTSKPDEMYMVMALSRGADCVLDRSEVSGEELSARIFSLQRRCAPVSECAEEVIVNGAVSLDRRRREIRCMEHNIRMTATEFSIVEHLMLNRGRICPSTQIYRSVWHEEPYLVGRTIAEHMRRIRSKLETNPHDPQLIKTVFGVGYTMVCV